MSVELPGKLYKTTIVIWSNFNPNHWKMEDLAREATSGNAYCSKIERVLVDPRTDPDWDDTSFFGEDTKLSDDDVNRLKDDVNRLKFHLVLIEGSIKHWEENSAVAVYDGDITREACACCRVYNPLGQPKPRQCIGCPIAEYTRERFCMMTPYSAAEDAQEREDQADWGVACDYMLELLNEIRADLEKRLNEVEGEMK